MSVQSVEIPEAIVRDSLRIEPDSAPFTCTSSNAARTDLTGNSISLVLLFHGWVKASAQRKPFHAVAPSWYSPFTRLRSISNTIFSVLFIGIISSMRFPSSSSIMRRYPVCVRIGVKMLSFASSCVVNGSADPVNTFTSLYTSALSRIYTAYCFSNLD